MFKQLFLWGICLFTAAVLAACSGSSSTLQPEDKDALAKPNNNGSPNTRSFEGEILYFFGSVLRLDTDVQFGVTSSTQFLNPDGTPADQDLFDPFDLVRVQARKSGRDLIAESVTLLINRTSTQEFTGAIDFIEPEFVSVQCLLFTFTDTSEFFLLDGTPTDVTSFDQGDLVTVKAFIDGEDITTLSMTLIDDNDTDPQWAFFGGMVFLLSETELGVGVTTSRITAETEWTLIGGASGEQSDFSVNDGVQVLARLDGGSWTAVEVFMYFDG